MRKFIFLLLVLCSPSLQMAQVANGQNAGVSGLSQAQQQAVDAAVQQNMEQQRAVGVAIGVIQQGRIVYLNGYGWADREKQVPVGADTLFRWASISKTLTAVAALQLVQSNKLDLDADVRSYVPEFPEKGVVITSREILCHQSGIPHYTNGQVIVTKGNYTTPHPFEDVVVALDKFKESPLLFTPGEKYSYSTYAYILLSAIVQRAGNQKFADQVQNRIAKPLRLQSLQPDYYWVENPNRAVGYSLKGDQVVPSTDTDVSWKLGGGGFMSNIEDLAGYACGLMGPALLSDQAKAAAWTDQKESKGEATGDGLGFFVTTQNGLLKVFHEGSQEKARCRMVFFPAAKTGVVVMTNSEYVDPGQISTAIFGALGK